MHTTSRIVRLSASPWAPINCRLPGGLCAVIVQTCILPCSVSRDRLIISTRQATTVCCAAVQIMQLTGMQKVTLLPG